MKSLLILLLTLAISGCATVEKYAAPESFAACSTADVATTAYAVHAGLAVEKNPLLAGSVNAHHFIPLVLSKLAVVGLAWWLYDYYQGSTAAKVGIGGAAAVTCGVAAWNASVILKAIH